MKPDSPPVFYVGLDVAKAALQLDLAGPAHALANDAPGHARLLQLLRPHPTAQVVCEATGGSEQAGARALHAAQVPVSVVEAGRVRHFAHAKGLRAKTDPLDAALLAAYGSARPSRPTPAPTAEQARLAALSTRRQQLLQTLTAETNRAAHYVEPFCIQQERQLRKLLEKQVARCDQAITALIAAAAALQAKSDRLDAIAGVGPVIAAIVLAEVPELGTLSDGAVAALVGVAPYNRDRGDRTARRHITGGRAGVRCALSWRPSAR